MTEPTRADLDRTATSSPPSPLLEREPELERIRAAIDSALKGAGTTLGIEGPPGIGKSRLVEATTRIARERGLRILAARSSELERRSSWGVARELFGPVVAEAERSGESDPLLAGAAALALPVLETAGREPAAQPDVAGSALHGTYWLTSNLCETSPVMITVDDVQWTDTQSLRLLAYLGRRAADLPLVILLAGRTATGAEAGYIASALEDAEILTPAPLSEAATATILDRTLGEKPGPDLVNGCVEVTGGNPFLVRELSTELRRLGVTAGSDAADRVRAARPEGIRRAVLLRLASLPDDATELALAVAVLDREASLANAATLAGLTEDEAARVADDLGTAAILDRGLPLSFLHPVMRSVVYGDVPTVARRNRLHMRAIETLDRAGADPEIPAAHALAVEAAGSVRVVAVLRAAAAAAISRGTPAGAVTYLRRALDEPPPEEDRATILADLSEVEASTGDPAAPGHADEALTLMPEGARQAALLLKLGRTLYAASRLPEAAATLERGLSLVDPELDPGLHAELSASLLGVSALLRKPDRGQEESRENALSLDPGSSPAGAERQLLAQRALATVFSAGPHSEARSLATRALGDGELLREHGVPLTFTMAVSCLLWSGALDEAERQTQIGLRRARDAGDLLTVAHMTFGLSQPRYWKGRVDDAAADAGTAINAWRDGLEMHLPLACHWRAVSQVELGDFAGAAATLDADPPRPGAAPIYEAFWRMARQRLALARGDFESAARELDRIQRLAAAIPYLYNPVVWPWRSDGGIALGRLGQSERASGLIEEELRIASRYGLARSIGVATRARGLVTGGDRGVELLRQAVSTLEHVPGRIELIRALVDLGAAMRRAGERSAARTVLRRGWDLAHSLNLLALEERTRLELAASGAHVGRPELSGPKALTPSERRVAELAAAGESNRQIAQQLFVSLRTVETHLTHTYRKLEIRSRRELKAALAADTAPGAGDVTA